MHQNNLRRGFVIHVTDENVPITDTRQKETWAKMDTVDIIAKLIEIQKAVGVENQITLHNMIMDAQDYVLSMQRSVPEEMRSRQRTALGVSHSFETA